MISEKTKNKIILTGYLICFSQFVLLYLTFLIAYFRNYSVTININYFNEAHIEFIVIPITLIICGFGLILYWKDFAKLKRK